MTHHLRLTCESCKLTDYVPKTKAKAWKCPICSICGVTDEILGKNMNMNNNMNKKDKDKDKEVIYSVEVYKDHAIIRGWIDSDVLRLVIRLCKKNGFTHMTNIGDGSQGMKLVKMEDL